MRLLEAWMIIDVEHDDINLSKSIARLEGHEVVERLRQNDLHFIRRSEFLESCSDMELWR